MTKYFRANPQVLLLLLVCLVLGLGTFLAVVIALVQSGTTTPNGEPSGVIRGYDAVTGKLAWAWDMDHPDRHGAPPEGETYSRGTPNSWGPMSCDEDQIGRAHV